MASIYDAAFPAMMFSRNGGSEKVLGLVNAVIGITTFSGFVPDPRLCRDRGLPVFSAEPAALFFILS